MASAVTRRYREADTIQSQRAPAPQRDFASALSTEPAVVATIGRATLNPPPPSRPLAEAVPPPRPAVRTVLPSPALAKRSAAAYEAAASIDRSPAADADVATPSTSGLSISC
ncbi:hypothetical protein [Azospirillum sp. TSO22-1]|uniref:hypothetical protein n=1 Tax=Azospirillum sp. TSO22-1 TaxID=716789 RepID=UPI000D6043D1|nr:hypothetical protein [Azospirillum sp. TSO22-1]PWC56647.1 hypothetical protein TSO221_01420 [Azospirillum sp. TSO22-1]